MKLQQILVYISFFLFSGVCIHAQLIDLEGKIIAENEETAFVNIINLSQKTGSISNTKGEFNVSVHLNDTLIFSAVQFEKLEVVISEEIIQNKFLEVQLVEKNNLLREIVLNPYDLRGNLVEDAQNMPSYVFDYKAAGLKPPRKPLSQTERRLHTATSTSVDYILNSINGRIKKLRMLNEWSKLDDLKIDIQHAIPKTYFVTDLGIEEKYLEDFIYFCIEDNALKSYVQNNEDLEIIKYLRLKADAYKLLKANEISTN